MPLTQAQLQTLKTDIAANTNTVTFGGSPVQIKDLPNSPDANAEIAAWYSAQASPSYWLWRTSIFESEITRSASADATTWSWTAYIGRSQGERDAWARLFMGGGSGMNPSLTNVRQGLADIFSGAGGSAQRTHLLAICRRPALRVEKLLAVAATGPGNDGGTRGTATNPDATTHEGYITYQDVTAARNLP